MNNSIIWHKSFKDEFIYINSIIESFLNLNPPCKSCLIQSMCMNNCSGYLKIKYCSELKSFLIKNIREDEDIEYPYKDLYGNPNFE